MVTRPLIDREFLYTIITQPYGDRVTEAYVQENIIRADNKIDFMIGGILSDETRYEALKEQQITHVKKAIAYFADYWIQNDVYKEGESTSASAGSISYSQTNTRAKDYVPEFVLNMLELSGLYSRAD